MLLGLCLSLGLGLGLGFVTTSQAGQSIALAWNPNTETNLAGYKLYYGTAAGVYSGQVSVQQPGTDAIVTNLTAGATYFFAVSAYSTEGLESELSTEISYVVPGPGSTNVPPTALPLSVTTAEEQSVSFTLRAADANGDPLTFVIVAPPINGLISGSSPNLTYRPNANFYGTDTLVFRVNDGRANSGLAIVTITVNPVNDTPTLAPPGNLSLPVNPGAQTVSLSGIGSGATNESQSLVVTASSSNTGLIPHPQVSYVSPSSTGSLSFTPVPNATGSATVTVTVNDGQSVNNVLSRTFVVTVGAPGNQPPTINPLADVVCNEDAQQQLVNFGGITAGGLGESQTLSVTAVSSNPGLIPHPTVRYDSPISAGYLTFTPVPGGFGTAEITVTVNDGQSTNNLTSRQFQVTVNPVNDPPTLSRINDVELYEDDGGTTVEISGIGSGATNEQQNLTVTAVSSNPSIIPDPVVRYDSPSSTGSLRITSVTNGVGSATITVTVNDGGGSRNTVVQTFYVAVRGVNDPPVMSRVPDQTIDANGSSGVLQFTVEDPDTALNSISLRAISSNPSLIPPTGLVVGGSGGNRTLSITPALSVSGIVQVSLAATDGYATNTQVIRVNVGYVNQAPTISAISNQTVDVSTVLANVPFQISDAETDAASLTLSATSANAALIPSTNVVFGGSGTNRTLSLTPLVGRTGTTMVSVAVSDGARRAQRAFQVIVRPVQARLTVNRSGRGTVTPDLNGQNLVVGASYTLTAVPDAAQLFTGWYGGVRSTNRTLTFVMSSNLVIESRFEADSYQVAKGSYNGLLAEEDQVRHETSGFFSVISTSRGSYSGKVQVGAGKYSISGLMGRDGRATNRVLRTGLSPLTVEVSLELGELVGRVRGRVTDGVWTALIEGDRQHYQSKTNPAPFAGAYTLTLPADTEAPSGPLGSGHGTVRVDGNGVASFLGVLADGSKSVQKVPLSRNGQWPFYLPLYRNAGAALGWLRLDNDVRVVDGQVSWIKPSVPSKYYAAGFTNESAVVGAGYVPPTPEELKSGARLIEVACLGGNLAGAVTNELMVLPNGKPLAAGGPVKFGFSPLTGLFKGTVQDPASGKFRTFSGVLLQKWGSGAGAVFGLDEVGLVEVAQP